ncbi:MAG: IctB family putative bicarbonate transporter [Phormidium sp. BM_Day4_Bin.17]|nr:IctB family putative bicarbonate transporter [Phormidium sp. BM_Day4_Bin.17]UCJ10708.1 MAG: IctB family putative bicarbonate transporter [Phormidium sp. PBR-2020]
MTDIWTSLTLSQWSPQRWQSGSYGCRLLFGSLGAWKTGSWLMQWADSLGVLVLSVLFALAPFVSTTLIGVLLALCAAFLLLLVLSDNSDIALTPIHIGVGLYWLVASLATALSRVPEQAMRGWVKLTLFLVVFALAARVLRSAKLRSILITVYLHTALVVSVYGMRQVFFGAAPLATWTDPTSASANVTRVYSYLGNPNLLAGYLIPAIALSLGAVFAWEHWPRKALALVMFGLNSIVLFQTYSRGGWIGMAATLFVFALLMVYGWRDRLPRPWRNWAIPAVLGGTVAVVLIAVTAVPPVRDRVSSLFIGRADSSNNFRINVWTSVIEMIRDHPVLGIGPGNEAFNQVYPLYMRPRYTALSAYSVLLEITVETGLVGLTAFLWLLLVTVQQALIQLQRLRRQANPDAFILIAAVASLAGFMAHGLVDTVWYRPQINTLWWLCLALVASFYPSLPPHSQPSEPSEA